MSRERYSVQICDLCGAQAADIGYACNHEQGGSGRFKRVEVVPADELERVMDAIGKHRRLIELREAGRRVSSVAADRELWSTL